MAVETLGGVYMLGFIKKLFEPKIGTSRWIRKASKADILALRDALQAVFMDPKRDDVLREQIHRYLHYLDKVIAKKK